MAYISDAELEKQKMESQKFGVIVLVLVVGALLFFVFKAIRKKKK
jgi:hypothetical protein